MVDRLRHLWLLLALCLALPAFAGRAEGTLILQVRDPDGLPVPEARVSVDGRAIGATGADGTATAGGLRAGRRVDVAVDPAEPAWAPALLEAVRVGEGSRRVLVDLDRSAQAAEQPVRLRVLVADPAGEPVPRATVTVDGLETGRTDAEGRLVHRGGRRAGASAVIGVVSGDPGWPARAVQTVRLLGGPQTVRVLLEGEAPPPERAVDPVPEEQAPPAPTGPEGDRDADGFPDEADACPDEAEVVNGWKDGDGCPDALAHLALWVIDEGARPVEGARVLVDGAPIGTTDAQGTLSTEPERPGRRVTVEVRAPGLLGAEAGPLSLGEGRTARTVVLEAADADGDGIPDREDACPEEPETLNRYADEDGCPDSLAVLSVLVLDPDEHPVRGAAVEVDGEVVGRTGPEGRLLVPELRPSERVTLVARADEARWAPGGYGAVDLEEGRQSITVELQRSSEASRLAPVLELLALTPEGRPIPGAQVAVDGLVVGRTDREGRYVLEGRELGADLVVAVMDPVDRRRASTVKTITLEGGPQTERLRLEGVDPDWEHIEGVDSDGDGVVDGFDECPGEPETVNHYLDEDGCPDDLATVVIEVRDPRGRPVPGATVRVGGEPSHDAPSHDAPSQDADPLGATDDQGALTLSGRLPGEPLAWAVEAPGEHLLPGEVRLADPREGRQRVGVELSWRDSDGDGLPDIDDACPGEVEVVNGWRDDDGCPDKLATVFVTVVDERGRAVPGRPVHVDGDLVGHTDPGGDMRVGDLRPGEAVDLRVGEQARTLELIEGVRRERFVVEGAIAAPR